MTFVLKSQELDALAEQSFELRLHEVHLRPIVDPEASGPSGPGYVRQTKTGELSLVVFVTKNAPLLQEIWNERKQSGELVEDEDYYSVEASDFSGRSWVAERVLPTFSPLFRDAQPCLAEARLAELRTDRTLRKPPSGSELEVLYRGDIDFPFNVAVESVETAGERQLQRSWGIRAAEFSVLGWDFFARQEGPYLRVMGASSETNPRVDFERRINEALEFVLGRRLHPTLVERRDGGVIRLQLTGAPINRGRGRMPLPVAFSPGGADASKAALDLLEKYIIRTGDHSAEDRPTLSIAVMSALEAASSPIDSHALDLAVAVEAILREEYGDAGRPSDEFKADLQCVLDAVSSLEVSGQLKERASGLLSMMTGPSAKGRLLDLARRGVAAASEVEAWDAIRNPAAHGRFLSRVDQEYVNHFNGLVMLFYRLIFEAVGYTGPYRDYGEIGWPWRRKGDGDVAE